VPQEAYSLWVPRPDQPDRYDQQTAFFDSRHEGITFLIGGNGAGTTECGVAKVADFVLQQQPAPRYDTPFWIIGSDIEQCIEALWKEKLWGHGHIKPSEIDWRRVRWWDQKAGLPLKVPLKPWPNRPGCNWVLEFKGYTQGREAMQARAIGGFLFSEQFPWSILEEVLRGCREYNFRGSKICEFTPVDPELSYELEEMIENDTVPEGWGIYRANTECAMEAGHVSESWFREFFGMVPEEMRETRMTGRFASYEGAVFQSLNPLVHYVDDDFMFPGGNFPSNVFHRRGKDWGAGPDNADACVWGYKNGKGQWFIYDEYVSTDQNYTVHDHLKAISDKWWWPQNNPHYGMMYADPSDQGNIRIASRFSEYHPEYDNFSIQNASNRVFEGIDYIRWLLKPDKALGGQPRLFVHKKNCPYLCRTLRTYRWERSNENSLNPRSAKPQPLKKDDHAVDALRYMVFSDANRTGTIPESMERKRDRKRHGVQVAGGRGR
jgi:phage terminase large subunit-like protein